MQITKYIHAFLTEFFVEFGNEVVINKILCLKFYSAFYIKSSCRPVKYCKINHSSLLEF